MIISSSATAAATIRAAVASDWCVHIWELCSVLIEDSRRSIKANSPPQPDRDSWKVFKLVHILIMMMEYIQCKTLQFLTLMSSLHVSSWAGLGWNVWNSVYSICQMAFFLSYRSLSRVRLLLSNLNLKNWIISSTHSALRSCGVAWQS